MVEAISNPMPAHAAAAEKNDPAKVRDAARQFESLLLAQLLKGMRGADSAGWLGGGEDQAGAIATELAEEQFAQALSAQGGLGLSSLIVSGLSRPGDEK